MTLNRRRWEVDAAATAAAAAAAAAASFNERESFHQHALAAKKGSRRGVAGGWTVGTTFDPVWSAGGRRETHQNVRESFISCQN